MAILIILLIIILLFHLGQKGKAYREERRIINKKRMREKARQDRINASIPTPEEVEQMKRDAQEAQYRKELEAQGYNEQLITTILPTLMNDEK